MNIATPHSQASIERVRAPIAEAAGLPNQAYTSEAFAQTERDQVLARGWTCIGAAAQVPQPGDIKPVTLLGLPLLLVRDQAGEVRVFHNVCSHRGMELVGEPGNVRAMIRCPYHSWSYGLDGKLIATPFIGGPGKNDCPGFQRARHGLKAVRTAIWFDTVFVNLSGDAPDFTQQIAPLAERWGAFDPSVLRHGGADSRFEIELDCNWKLAVENYCEAYHLPWIHPSLNSYSRLEDHYNIEMEDSFAGQGSLVYRPQLSEDGRTFPQFPSLPAEWDGTAEYIALFPNVLFGIHGDHFFSVTLIPVDAGHTRELFEIYYTDETALDDHHWDLRQSNTRLWQTIFEEDRGVVEGMQRGRHSTAFKGGVFSPAMDGPTHCFHKWVAGRLLAGSQGLDGT
ncbi:MAG: aromatic ring-hydroxylating dioxygenase subunit alpha [Pseudomonadota bacterium]